MNIHLLIHNIVSIASVIGAFGTGLFAYLHNRRSEVNIAFAGVFFGAGIFALSHVIGVNIVDPNLSRTVLMANAIIFFIAVFQVHGTLAITGKAREKRRFIRYAYAAAGAIVVFFMIFPDLFLLPSAPKMYFPSYYVPGILNWTRVFFLYGLAVPYSIVTLYKKYRTLTNPLERNQYRYLILTFLIGYGVAFIPNFLVYDIPLDPLWGMPFAILFSIPFAYGAVRFSLLDVKIIAKQAVIYSFAVGAVGGLIILLNYFNDSLHLLYPSFPGWITPLSSSLLVVTVSTFVWIRLREDDLLKYEFINTVTHKFRTPLTRIKWASETLRSTPLSDSQMEQLGQIESSDLKLVDLTNVLLNVSRAEGAEYEYKLSKHDLAVIAVDVVSGLENQAAAKNISFEKKIEPNLDIECDAGRIKFVMQVLIENALHYTRAGGLVSMVVRGERGEAVFSVKDNGIGLTHDEISRLFTKFYRGRGAKLADTEGMGIGLYISRSIIERHDGRIWATSEGPDRGATFSFSLPRI